MKGILLLLILIFIFSCSNKKPITSQIILLSKTDSNLHNTLDTTHLDDLEDPSTLGESNSDNGIICDSMVKDSFYFLNFKKVPPTGLYIDTFVEKEERNYVCEVRVIMNRIMVFKSSFLRPNSMKKKWWEVHVNSKFLNKHCHL